MLIWIIRVIVLMLGPVIAYNNFSRTPGAIAAGFLIALALVATEFFIEAVPLDDFASGLIGAILGLIAYKLIEYSLSLLDIDKVNVILANSSVMMIVRIAVIYISVLFAIKKKNELDLLDKNITFRGKKIKEDVKILDTSVAIDGRICDIAEARFLSGLLVIPSFVLRELQALSDSHDSAKRAKGRRGLDMISRLQEKSELTIKIFDKDYPKIEGVDGKLVKLSEDLKAKLMTVDFNLAKVAELQGIQVMNINNLAMAIKTVAVPGESMNVFIAKEGKEHSQGVAYLEDGTMVVVEDGHNSIGRKVVITVTNIIQSGSGRIVFGKLADRV